VRAGLPRALAVVLTGLLVACGCVVAGFWQLERHEQRQQANAQVRSALAAPVVPLADLETPTTAAWRSVEVVGRYLPEPPLLLRQRSVDGVRGVQVLSTLRAVDGATILVDRGLLPTTAGPTTLPDAPAPPAGDVRLIARVRLPETTSGSGWDPTTGTARAVDLADLAAVGRIPPDIAEVWLQAVRSTPADDPALLASSPPRVSMGPSLFYAVQWWIFAVLAVVGTVLLLRRDRHERTLAPVSR